MNTKATYQSYRSTGAFASIVLDYLDQKESLKQFYAFSPDADGIHQAIAQKKDAPINRSLLVKALQDQYLTLSASEKTKKNIECLKDTQTFTICTAHQPNLFTGHLYFIYKIVHAIKLADHLNKTTAGAYFVPVFYMGTEDADLQELGQVQLNGRHYQWLTDQQGAVGRMQVDKSLIQIIEQMEGQLAVEPFGHDLVSTIRAIYTLGKTIEQATFELVNHLFADFGLVVLLPDRAMLKQQAQSMFRKELQEGFSQKAIQQTAAGFPKEYGLQAKGRSINLFYLKDQLRQRIEATETGFTVVNTDIAFSPTAILKELEDFPERFSPNVILRPVFQELILPNVAFIGGGGELAYWLGLKPVFESAGVDFPVLLLRNSFLLLPHTTARQIEKLSFQSADFFKPLTVLEHELVNRDTQLSLSLEKEKSAIMAQYQIIKTLATKVDVSLQKHIESLQAGALKKIEAVEKKMLRAEKRKFEVQLKKIQRIRHQFFPHGMLQERVDNFSPFYAKWGPDFIKQIYQHSLVNDSLFCIIEAMDA